ncbi:hypothetical protein [Aliiglaciecola sp. M165]|uniref:hypothetical protein n=1 Tax=Aliiglaciecola sp. M165 TaxID=2593649 RepID=UPI0011805C62|nr:hypothetical protein [Aliiglaciecola sp. M165]TRY29787.1 hypothetical protein FM019_16585 [Aliiglaciecola sp. M165]
MINLTDIQEFVSDFRNACDKVNWQKMPLEYQEFPLGTCGAMSQILASFLIARGYENIEYVAGERNSQSHAWLEIERIAIDVTASQFNEIGSKILCQKKSEWHNQYVEQQRFLCSGELSPNRILVSNAIYCQLNQ